MKKNSDTLLLNENEPGFEELAYFFWRKKWILLFGLLGGLTIGISYSRSNWQPAYTTDLVFNLASDLPEPVDYKAVIAKIEGSTAEGKLDFFF